MGNYYNVASASCLQCPTNHYCEGNSSAPVPCSMHTESSSVGASTSLACTACPTGFRTFSSGGACQPCPGGYACASSSFATSICPAATYSPLGNDTCTLCPAGAACPTAGGSSFSPCLNGTYALGGAVACSPCSAGHACPSANVAPSPCDAGTYSPGGAVPLCLPCQPGTYSLSSAPTCLACPPGSACSDPSQTPSLCLPGYYSPGGVQISCLPCGSYTALNSTCSASGFYANYTGAAFCSVCEAGFACPYPDKSPVPCAAGYYSPAQVATCASCPAGTYATAGAENCNPCPLGYQCLPAAAQPLICGEGSIAATVNATSCQPCQPGYHSNVARTQCLPCTAGYACGDPALGEILCPLGTSSQGTAATNCTQCQQGYYCPTTASLPIACVAGQYCPQGAIAPSRCGPGFFCPLGCGSPTACPGGSYALGDAAACVACPPGHTCANSSLSAVPCPPGYFAAGSSLLCTLCPPGYACPSQMSAEMVACPLGSWSEGRAQNCTVCPPSFACPSTTAAIQVPCAPGSFSLGAQDNCTLCPAGWACPLADGSGNVACALGTQAVQGSASCVNCPAGKFCPNPASGEQIDCPAGWYALAGSPNCTACLPGFACADRTLPTAVACGAGTYSRGGQAACTPCPAGFACPFVDQAVVTACSPGFYSPGATQFCSPCEAGRYCAVTNSSSTACPLGSFSLGNAVGNCSICPAGYECSNAAVLPQPCPAGTFAPPMSIACSACQPGWICGPASTTATPGGQLCPAGGYCNPPTQWFACPAGTYGNGTGGTSAATACRDCPPGFFCPLGASNYTAFPCLPGHYCPALSVDGVSNPCPAGTHNPLMQRVSLDACLPCPEGYYCPSATPSGLIPPGGFVCPSGHYCPLGTGDYLTFPCPLGTYSGSATGLIDASQCLTCPPGSYCGAGSTNPTLCPAGGYQPLFGASVVGNCIQCTASQACPIQGLTAPSLACLAGHYCPTGTVFPSDFPCPPGRITNSTTLTTAAQCDICPMRYACGWGTGGTVNPALLCAPGHYCPAGTGYQTEYPCAPGTYSNLTNLAAASECYQCPRSFHCVGGMPTISGPCAPGHYCPMSTALATDNPCPSGFYTAATDLYDANQCSQCPPGYHCVSPAVAPTACLAGSYSPVNKTLSQANCPTCPAGFYCPTASINPLACGVGQHSGPGAASCLACQVGHYCDNATTATTDMLANKRCMNGTYCPPSMSAAPTLFAQACSTGHYCPEATALELSCPPGTMNGVTGRGSLADCINCPAGFYCLVDSVAVSGVCDPGYYCPEASTGPQQLPCPAGTYRSITQGMNTSSCAECVSGKYCPLGTANPLPCPQGYFCVTSTVSPEPCPKGTYGNTTDLRKVSDCTACPGGRFCDTLGLLAPSGLCDPGFYCLEKAYTSSPTGPPTGGLCPRGGFCPVGSSYPSACSPGTYNNYTGGQTNLDCNACSPGFYCSGSSNPYPTAPCDPGYYCPSGSKTATEVLAPPGTYTGFGAPSPIPCPVGTYNTEYGQKACKPCTGRYYCPELGSVNLTSCPAGAFCPEGSAVYTLCPAGTYSSTQNLLNYTECTQCDPGFYCFTNGIPTPTAPCLAGYYCSIGSSLPNPVGQVFGDVCSTGHYCPLQTHTPLPCPTGTYSGAQGNKNVSDCLPCPANSYCQQTGLSTPEGSCSPGYYCTGGAKTPTPTSLSTQGGAPCPAGTFCGGNLPPQTCPPGTFANQTGLSLCFECWAGHYCLAGQIFPLLCPMGQYCPPGSDGSPPSCPAGTFSARLGLNDSSQCLSCTGGYYCAGTGNTAPSGNCSAGYYCSAGAQTATGLGGVAPLCLPLSGDICPAGHFCPEGSSAPTPCPPGTFRGGTGGQTLGECAPCPAGKACPSAGTVLPSLPCAAGYVCLGGAASTTPANGPSGYACPIGHYCPAGSIQPLGCPPGTYNGMTTQGNCSICPAGYYCLSNSTTYLTSPCPSGHVCLAGSVSGVVSPCPPGTYNNLTTQTSLDNCIPCDSGQYCGGFANVVPTGPCTNGYWCRSRVATATPALDGSNGDGGPCLAGSYCPSGIAQPLVCPPGSYCGNALLQAPSGLCLAGYVCLGNATVSSPTDGLTGKLCPAGSYCPEGSGTNILCPPGTFSNSTGQGSEQSCANCTGGSYCNVAGLTKPAGSCFAGFYCSAANRNVIPNAYACPRGNFCPLGSAEPQGCPPGSYQNSVGLANCISCPLGFTCIGYNRTWYEDCPIGHYCESSNSLPTPCPVGTIGTAIRLGSSFDCTNCPRGSYCQSSPLSSPTNLCSAGYYCNGTDTSPTPGGVYPASGQCPAGFYCPMGALTPVPCAPGTFRSSVGGASSADCSPCTTGKYCASSGQATVSGGCLPGYYCPFEQNSTAPNVTATICPRGHYCPAGSGLPLGCPGGSFAPATGALICQTCSPGFYCHENATNEIPCPLGMYCPSGSAYSTYCPLGTFSSTGMLTNASQCASCPAGSYCSNGTITGICQAGYLCLGNAGSSAPSGMACPAGNYCPSGSIVPIPCANGTVNPYQGGSTISDCVSCPAGYLCTAGIPVPEACSPGTYCPMGNDPNACPRATYQPLLAQSNISACLPCPAGFFCNQTALGGYTHLPCPAGKYCPAASEPVNCPVGSYQNGTGAANINDCKPCPAGFYCGVGAPTPIPCPGGYYCPLSSAAPRECLGGTYCPSESTAMTACPPGYNCPNGTSVPILCRWGSYCPISSSYPTPCPPGTHANSASSPTIRDQVSHCAACPSGTFSDSPTGEVDCQTCTGGYVCLGGTNTGQPTSISLHQGYICPVGFYCEAGSSIEVACPVGTYSGDSTGHSLRSHCKDCPANTFQDLTAQVGCLACGVSSVSDVGSTTCSCIGSNRAYQKSDGKCICKPRYEYYDETLQKSDSDSPYSCQPVVYDRCDQPDQGRNSTGGCIDTTSSSTCSDACPGSSGSPAGGSVKICECQDAQHQDTVCGKNCRASALQLQISSSGNITLHDPVNGTNSYVRALNDVDGKISCNSTTGCIIQTIAMTTKGFFGIMTADSAYYDSVLTGVAEGTGGTITTARRLHSTTSTAVRGISNPITCLELGNTVLWDISNANSHYPIYVKDSLFNTNDNFDYGEFRDLKTKMESGTVTVSAFAFTFNEPGTYVFADKSSDALQMIINVRQAGVSCSTEEGDIFSQTSEHLVSQGASGASNIVLAPNWFLIALMILFFVILVVGIIFFLYQFRKRSWGQTKSFRPRYRRLGQAHDFDIYASKGSTIERRMKLHKSAEKRKGKKVEVPANEKDGGLIFEAEGFGNEFWDYERQIDLEGFSVKTLYDKLEDQSLHVAKQLAKQQEEARSLYESVKKETQALTEAATQLTSLAKRGGPHSLTDFSGQDGGAHLLNQQVKRDAEVLSTAKVEKINADKHKMSQKKSEQALPSIKKAHHTVSEVANARKKHAAEAKARIQKQQEMLEVLVESYQSGGGKLPKEMKQQAQKLTTLCSDHMKNVTAEKERRCVGAKSIGGELLEADRDQLIKDPLTGLTVVPSSAKMKIIDASGHEKIVAVPHDSMLHPETGRVVPAASLRTLDPSTGKIVLSYGEKLAGATEVMPLLTNSASRPYTGTKPLVGTLKMGAKMLDPSSGRVVPILGATVEPGTGRFIPVGGVHHGGLEQAISPIRIGDVFVSPNGEAVVIAGIAIDADTGEVRPVGGDVVSALNEESPAISGLSIKDGASGLYRVTDSATLDAAGNVQAVYGGGRIFGDGVELHAEAAIAEALAEMTDLLRNNSLPPASIPARLAELQDNIAKWEEALAANQKKDVQLLGVLEENMFRAQELALPPESMEMHLKEEEAKDREELTSTEAENKRRALEDLRRRQQAQLAGKELPNMSEEEKNRILAEHSSELALLQSKLAAEAERQALAMEKKLAEKRARKAKLAALEELKLDEKDSKLQLNDSLAEKRKRELDALQAKQRDEMAARQQMSAAMTEQEKAAILAQYAEQTQQLEASLTQEAERQRLAMEQKLAAKRKKKHLPADSPGDSEDEERNKLKEELAHSSKNQLDALQRDFVAQIEEKSRKTSLTDDEKARILKQHDIELQQLQESLLSESERQRLALEKKLAAKRARNSQKMNHVMVDSTTGLIVPIVGHTVHPHTGMEVPLGGTYRDAETGEIKAIVPGELMLDADTGLKKPITGCRLDPVTGVIFPTCQATNLESLPPAGAGALLDSDKARWNAHERRVDNLLHNAKAAEKSWIQDVKEGLASGAFPSGLLDTVEDLEDIMARCQAARADTPLPSPSPSDVGEAAAIRIKTAVENTMQQEKKTIQAHENLVAFVATMNTAGRDLEKKWNTKINEAVSSHNPEAESLARQQLARGQKDLAEKIDHEWKRLEENAAIQDSMLEMTRKEEVVIRDSVRADIADALQRPAVTVAAPELSAPTHRKHSMIPNQMGPNNAMTGFVAPLAAEDLARMIANLLGMQLNSQMQLISQGVTLDESQPPSSFGAPSMALAIPAIDSEGQDTIPGISPRVEAKPHVTPLNLNRRTTMADIALATQEEQLHAAAMEEEKLAQELVVEEEEKRLALSRQLVENRKKAVEALKRKQRDDLLVSKQVSADERERILRENAEDVKSLEESLYSEAERQKSAMEKKLAAKRKKKEDSLKKELQEKEQQLKTPRVPISGEPVEASVTAHVIAAHVASAAAKEEKLLENDHELLQLALQERQRQEREQLAADLEEAQRKLEKKAQKVQAAAKAKALHEKEQQLEAELKAAGQLNDEEKQRILQKHKQDLLGLEKTIDSERDRQSAAMREKLEKKKKKKQEAQRLQQEAEMKAEIEARKQEKDEARTRAAREAEKKAIAAALENNQLREEDLTEVVEIALQQRHQQELKGLLLQYRRRKVTEIDQAMSKLSEKHTQQRAELDESHTEALQNCNSERERNVLRSVQNAEVAALEDTQFGESNKTERDIVGLLETEEAKERMVLRERQLREVAETCEILAPEDVLRREAVRQAERAAEEIAEFRSKLKTEEEEQLQKIKEEKVKFEEEQRKHLQEELKAYETEIEQERQREEERARKRKHELDIQKEKMKKEQQERQQQELEMLGDMAEDQKALIMEQHHNDWNAQEKSLETERMRQQKLLESKMAERRERRKKEKLREVEVVLQKEIKQKELENSKQVEVMHKRQMEVIAKMQTVSQSAEKSKRAVRQTADKWMSKLGQRNSIDASIPLKLSPEKTMVKSGSSNLMVQPSMWESPRKGSNASLATARGAPEMDEATFMNHLMKTPIYEKLRDIESLLLQKRNLSRAGEEPDPATPPSDMGLPVPGVQTRTRTLSSAISPLSDQWPNTAPLFDYIDDREVAFERAAVGTESVDVVEDIGTLPALCFVSYRFGVHVADMLTIHGHFAPVRLLLASNLPANTSWRGNAFRYSYSYDEDSNTLYVRAARAETVGEFVLVLMHALAHIQCGQFSNDSEPGFVLQFHRATRVLSDLMFATRARAQVDVISSALESQVNSNARDQVISQLVDLTPNIDDADEDESMGVSLADRLQNYAKLTASSRLREFVLSLEDHANSQDAMDAYGGLEGQLADLSDGALPTTKLEKRSSIPVSGDPYSNYLEANVRRVTSLVDSANAEFLSSMRESIALSAVVTRMEEEVREANATEKVGLLSELSNQLRTQKSSLQKAQVTQNRAAKRLEKLRENMKSAIEQLEEHQRKTEEEKSVQNSTFASSLQLVS